jgi:threonine synthase
VVNRFGTHMKAARPEFLRAASLAEGAVFIPAGEYKGVHLTLLDLCSLNASHTFKDWIAAVVVASCLEQRVPAICFQSSSNTGAALIRYTQPHGIKAVWFYPRASRMKLDPAIVGSPHAILVEVQKSEPELKALVAAFSGYSGVKLAPTLEQQIQANTIRAQLVKQYFLDTGHAFDWQSQALSSAFGPFGFYDGWAQLEAKEPGVLPAAPRFLGIHQSSCHPFTDAVPQNRLTPTARAYLQSGRKETTYLEPTLFRSTVTADMAGRMNGLLNRFGGQLDIMAHDAFSRFQAAGVELLEAKGLHLGRDQEGRIVEKAGLIALAGAMRAIDCRVITPGESVLVALTGGVRPEMTGKTEPHYVIGEHAGAEEIQGIFERIAGAI